MTLAIRYAGSGGLFLCQILLMRCLGVSGFGEYALAIAWLHILTSFAKLGLENTSLRYASEYVTHGRIDLLRSFNRDSTRAVAISSLLLMAGVLFTVVLYRSEIGESLSYCMMASALMIPLISIRHIQETRLRAVGRLFESQIATAIWPFMLLAFVGIAWPLSSFEVSSSTATTIHLIATAGVALLVYSYRHYIPNGAMATAANKSLRSQWSKTALLFLVAEILIVLKSRGCVVAAGMLLDSKSAGLYYAMEKFASVSILASQSLGNVIAPQFASLYAARRFHEMRRLMWNGQLIGLSFTVPVVLIVGLFGDQLLTFVGPHYREGLTVLLLLLTSTCIASFSGPAVFALQMTGCERAVMWITAACAVTNIAMSVLLMQSYGVTGLGMAQVATSLVWTIGTHWCLRQHPAFQRVETDAAAVNFVQPEVAA